MTDPSALKIRSKVWLEDDSGNVVFGLGRLKMLEAVQRLGSIQAAGKELGMSYRGIWGRIKATEQRLGQALLERSIGGASGGGSSLTPYAVALMERFRELHREVAQDADRLFQSILQPTLDQG
jgi:molybdate transport system regulatory protein